MKMPDVIYVPAYSKSLKKGLLTGCTTKTKEEDKKYILKDTLIQMIKEIDDCYVRCGYGEKGFYRLVEEIKEL